VGVRQPAREVGPEGVAGTIRRLRAGAGADTDTGSQLGREPTGRTFEITVIDIARFAHGQMVEHWGVPDRLSLLQQLGHTKGPARESSPS